MTGHPDPLSIVGDLHAGVIDPEAWTAGLDGISDSLGGLGLMFIGLITGRSGYQVTGHRLPDRVVDMAGGMLAVPDPAINPWFAAVPRLPRQKIIRMADIGPAEVEKSLAYQDGMVGNGIYPGPGAILERLPERIDISMTFRALGPYDTPPDQSDIYAMLIPHLARAIRVRHELAAMQALTANALDALDSLARGIVLTAPDGSLRFANRAARRILDKDDGLRAIQGRIETARHGEQNRLDAMIRGATQTSIGTAAQAVDAVALARPSGKTPYAIVAEPLAPPHNESLGGKSHEGAILFLSDSEEVGRPPPARLALLYGLTPAEAEVTSRLAHGERRADIAEALGVSAHTVKTHQIAIFDKLGVHGHVELVRRVASDIGDLSAGQVLDGPVSTDSAR